MSKKELIEVCEKEFTTFSSAINKMGFDPQGFDLLVLFDKTLLTNKKIITRFSSLT